MPSQHPKQVRFLDDSVPRSWSPPVVPDSFNRIYHSSPRFNETIPHFTGTNWSPGSLSDVDFISSVPTHSHALPMPHISTTSLSNNPRRLLPQVCLETGILSWNILDDPLGMPDNTRHTRPLASTYTLAQPATDPPVSFMRITSPHLPWSIKVYASTDGTKRYITVQDFLVSIYYSLRENITAHEFDQLPSENDKMRVRRAYESRYRRLREIDPAAYEMERQGGVKRVDFLIGRLHFDGIELVDHMLNEWRLIIS
ncbi:hypothetical protein CVT25_006908 [Psilocybe cyanescens]|uniref:DUF6699 domain-containing protein n=1 Tax=Psilocybe cyanescens TaxID=93625 RepID=A0A409X643_PSICY|nr:hypothetical protein CVT25_006908 [Psilocybe cyanescens]